MDMGRKINIVLTAIIALSLVASLVALFLKPREEASGVMIVNSPAQTEAERPSCFPDPEENYIALPETTNLAEGKKIISGEHTDVYAPENVNDGKTDTYWESKGFPAEMTIDLGENHKVSTVAVRLNPSSVWEARTQEIAVFAGTGAEKLKEVSGATRYDFDPATGNRIRIDFGSTDARFVKVVFTLNSSSRTGGAQAAEIEVYE